MSTKPNRTFILDIAEGTINGRPMTSEDIGILLGMYNGRHPEDKHMNEVGAYYAYHRMIKDQHFDQIVNHCRQQRAIAHAKYEQNDNELNWGMVLAYSDVIEKVLEMRREAF